MSGDVPCREMDVLLAERASGGVPVEERARLDAHLAACERCRVGLVRYQRTFEAVRESAGPGHASASDLDLASSTLRRWKRGRRRRAAVVAAGSAALAAAAAASLALAPGVFGSRSGRTGGGAPVAASWEPDVDGALEASGLQRDVGQEEEEMTTVDVVLAAFDASDPER